VRFAGAHKEMRQHDGRTVKGGGFIACRVCGISEAKKAAACNAANRRAGSHKHKQRLDWTVLK